MPSFSRVFLAAGAMLTAVLVSGCGDAPTVESAPSALSVKPMTVAASDRYTQSQRFSGRVEAARRSALGFELGGELARVLVAEGATVERGDALARLDTARVTAARAEAAAALSQAEAQSELATATLTRIEAALEFDGVSAQEVDQARESAQRAEASRAAAAARLQRLDVDLAKSVLRAPYDGEIVARLADEGQVLAAGQTVLSVQESAALEVRLSVTGEVIDSLVTGARVELQVDGRAVPATVKAVISERDLRTRAIEVMLQLDDGAPARAGDIAELRFGREIRQSGFWVPINALTEGARGVWSVLAVRAMPRDEERASARSTGATHLLERRPVEILYNDADRAYVRGALTDGDVIVADGVHRVVAGQGVRVLDESATDTLADAVAEADAS